MSNPKWHFTPLSNDQKAILCILARDAFDLSLSRFAVDDGVKYDDWRREQQLKACGVASLTKANQGHFLLLRGHWFVIVGNLEAAFQDFLKAGDQNEATRQMKFRLMGQIALLAEGITFEKARIQIMLTAEQAANEAWNYTRALALDKSQRQKRLDQFAAEELEELGFTVVNRANAKLKRGKPENRNKGQRLKKPQKAAEEIVLEPFERPSKRDEQPHEIELTQPLGEREAMPS